MSGDFNFWSWWNKVGSLKTGETKLVKQSRFPKNWTPKLDSENRNYKGLVLGETICKFLWAVTLIFEAGETKYIFSFLLLFGIPSFLA